MFGDNLKTMRKTTKDSKTNCSICKQPIYDNINPEKIITCANCVQSLLKSTQESKISFKNKLLEIEDFEAARSIESFILPEVDREIATFKKSCLSGRSNRLLHGFRRRLNGRSRLNRKG